MAVYSKRAAVPPKPSLTDVRRVEEAMRSADDAAALAAKARGLSLGEPVLVVTVSALARARRALGCAADAKAVLSFVAEAQGLSLGDVHPSECAGFLSEVAVHVASGTSFASAGRMRGVFLNFGRAPYLVSALSDEMPWWQSVRWPMETCLLHEIGHVAEVAAGHRRPTRDFSGVPARWSPRGVPDRRVYGLRAAVQAHVRECYADGFQVAAALAMGEDRAEVAAVVAAEAVRFFDADWVAMLESDPFWEKRPLWRGTYATVGATSAVLARPPAPGAGAEALAGAAQDAVARGMLAADALLDIGFGRLPPWYVGLDATGETARALARVREAVAHRQASAWDSGWLDGISDPTDRLFRAVASRACAPAWVAVQTTEWAEVMRGLAGPWRRSVLTPQPAAAPPAPRAGEFCAADFCAWLEGRGPREAGQFKDAAGMAL